MKGCGRRKAGKVRSSRYDALNGLDGVEPLAKGGGQVLGVLGEGAVDAEERFESR